MNAETVTKTDTSNDAALPLFYKSILPLFDKQHRDIVIDTSADYSFAAAGGAIPLLADEVAIAQAHYPIVFSPGADPVPLAVIGLPQQQNRYVDDTGAWKADTYVPAYVRRYPFILAKLDPNRDALTLCVDAASSRIDREAGKGNIFTTDGPTELAKGILNFCEQFEGGARRTKELMAELVRLDLLIDGQAEVRPAQGLPSVFKGFQIVSETKLGELSDAAIAALARSGAMALILAHFFSLRRILDLATDPLSDSETSAAAPSQMPSADLDAGDGEDTSRSSRASNEADGRAKPTRSEKFGKRRAAMLGE